MVECFPSVNGFNGWLGWMDGWLACMHACMHASIHPSIVNHCIFVIRAMAGPGVYSRLNRFLNGGIYIVD